MGEAVEASPALTKRSGEGEQFPWAQYPRCRRWAVPQRGLLGQHYRSPRKHLTA